MNTARSHSGWPRDASAALNLHMAYPASQGNFVKTTPKLLLSLVAVAGLGGCAVYPAPGYGPYESAGVGHGQPYLVESSPFYLNGGVGYELGYAPPVYQGGRGYGPGYAGRDRDGDGVVNRADRGRDGDGVRSRSDARPNNPYQR